MPVMAGVVAESVYWEVCLGLVGPWNAGYA